MIRVIKQILPKERHCHLAVSMWVDSVAALFWLRWKGYSFTPLHFDHNLRAQNGTMRETFHRLCEKLNIEGRSEQGKNLKTEAECREARLDFYSRTAAGSAVVTAHHLDDWIESYLLNCFRGHPNHNPFELESQFSSHTVIHPFLLTRKGDFREFLERNGWMEWVVEDETNKIVKGSRRNWVRSVILPEMSTQKLSLEKYAKRRLNKLLEKVK
jgi:tRNA(Ile)-lysidine synthase TilS/MesJ